jgi:hypothetical protein
MAMPDDPTKGPVDFHTWVAWRIEQPRPPASPHAILNELRVLGGVGIAEIVADVVLGLLDEPEPKVEIVPPQMMAYYDLVLTRRSAPAADNATGPLVVAAIKPTPSLPQPDPPVMPGLLDEPGLKVEIVPPQNIATMPLVVAAIKAMRESLSPDIVVLVPSLLPPPPPLSKWPISSPPLPTTPSLPQPAPDHPPAIPPARYGALTFRLADPVRFYRYLDGLLGQRGAVPPAGQTLAARRPEGAHQCRAVARLPAGEVRRAAELWRVSQKGAPQLARASLLGDAKSRPTCSRALRCRCQVRPFKRGWSAQIKALERPKIRQTRPQNANSEFFSANK